MADYLIGENKDLKIFDSIFNDKIIDIPDPTTDNYFVSSSNYYKFLIKIDDNYYGVGKWDPSLNKVVDIECLLENDKFYLFRYDAGSKWISSKTMSFQTNIEGYIDKALLQKYPCTFDFESKEANSFTALIGSGSANYSLFINRNIFNTNNTGWSNGIKMIWRDDLTLSFGIETYIIFKFKY